MKKNIYLLPAIIILAISCNTLYAQAKINSDKDAVIYHCDSLKTNTEMNLMTLVGNVSVKTKDLSLVNCEKVDWDLNSKTITAYHVASFDFNGHVTLVSEAKNLGVLEYVIDDNTVFIK